MAVLENFEGAAPGQTSMLDAYGGGLYTADANWLDQSQCNGLVIGWAIPEAPGDCPSPAQFDLRLLAALLNNGSDTFAVGAYTQGNPGPGVVLQSTNPVPLSAPVQDRFLGVSVDVAATNCDDGRPSLTFDLVDAGVVHRVTTTPIEPCPGVDQGEGTFRSDGSVLYTGTDVDIVMRNENGSGIGNDYAFDNIRILDTTPQLDMAFTATEMTVGQTSRLTYTVTNTDDLASKVGWSFLDTLPIGVTVAAAPNVESDCGAGTNVTAIGGGITVAVVSGNLVSGATSCTISVDVTSDTLGTYTNGPDDMTMVGLNPPAVATLQVIPQPAFTCTPAGLLSQGGGAAGSLVAIDLVTGDDTTVASDFYAHNVNAMGYNVLDDYVYGVAGSAGNVGPHLARVGADGSVVAYPFPAGVPSASYHIGDVDENGHLWISNNSAWYRIDVSSESSPTYMTLLDSGTVSILGLADWAHVPGTDALYAVSSPGGTNQLFRFDRASGTATQVADLGLLGSGGAFGAAFADADGYLYVSQNDTGQIFRIDVVAGTAESFAPGPASTTNDGAMCADARILLDFGDAPDTYGTTLASDGARHGLGGFDATTSTAPLMLGATVDDESDAIAGAAADGDGADEDAVSAPIVYVPGEATSVDVVVTNTTGGVATLAVWVDADRDGTFDEAPVLAPVADGTAAATITVAVGTLTGEDDTYARIRLFPGDVAQPSAVGPASAGEVEDVLVAVAAPALALDKSAALDDADVNGAADVDEVITYSFAVTNTGNTPVTGITITDPLPGLSAVDCPAADLAVGADMTCTATYVVTQADVDAGEVTNSATASGDSPAGPVSSPPSGTTVDTVTAAPGLSLVKTADLDDVENPGEADDGEIITYRFVVTNTGNVTMSDVTVEDPLPGLTPVVCPTDVLAPGETMTCTATYTVTEDVLGGGALENEATAVGTPPDGDPITSPPSQASTPLAAGPPPSIIERVTSLPRTGASLLGVTGTAVLLVLAGAALVVRSRWRLSLTWLGRRPHLSLRTVRRGGAHLRRVPWTSRLERITASVAAVVAAMHPGRSRQRRPA